MLLKLRILLLRFYYNSFGLLRRQRSAEELIKLFTTPRSRVIRQKEIEILNNANTDLIDFQGHKVKLYEWGDGEEYILLCHGWESNAGSLGAFVEPLVKRGYRVVAYDSLAHGKSEGQQSNMIIFKEIAKSILDKLGKPKVAIGHSLGANVIVLLAKEEAIDIPKVILISPFNQLRAIFLGFKDILKIPEPIYSVMLDQVSYRFNYDVREMEFGIVGHESPLKDILIMHDRADKITPFSHSHTMAKRWKKAKLLPLEGSGHYKILWHPDTLEHSFRFIDQGEVDRAALISDDESMDDPA
jgi:pimeloyl-ACP methyl ester carboxylesterase